VPAPRVARVAAAVAALVALVLLGRMAVFMVDADQTQLSIQPSNAWRTEHACLTAYAEAARFAAEGGHNIYDGKLYEQRFIHGLKVDAYHYPPPFLLVPGALQRLSGGFLELRPWWFALQIGVVVLAFVMIARWVGGRLGQHLLLASPLYFIAPTTLFTLQMGNFQSTAMALSLIGMIALSSSRTSTRAAGGFALAYAALSKVFPGVLGVYLLVTRRWRALAWTVAAGVVLTAVALAVYGTAPFSDFIGYELPRLSSGEAFPQTERFRVAASNMSFYGVLVKLRVLGLGGPDLSTGLAINTVYGLVVLALAGALAWRRRDVVLAPASAESRAGELAIWLALVNLAAMRSPFVGGAYGVIGMPLLTLVCACSAETRRARIAWWAAFAVMFVAPFAIATPRDDLTHPQIALALAVQLTTIALNAWVCIGGLLRASRPMLKP
jgi:hypothetical protein